MIALVGLMCIGALNFLENTTSNLISVTATNEQNGISAYVNSVLGGKDSEASNKSKGLITQTDAGLLSGKKTDFLLDESPVADTNTTGSEGNEIEIGLANVRFTVNQAKQLDDFAESVSNEELKRKLKILAFDAYWIAGSQSAYEFHTHNNMELTDFSTSILNASTPNPELGRRALYSAKANSEFLNKGLKKILSMPEATPEQKAFVQNLVNEINAKNARYEAALQKSKQENPIPPERGLKFNDIGDGSEKALAKSKTAQYVKAAGLTALNTGKVDKTPAVKTSIKGGRDTENLAKEI